MLANGGRDKNRRHFGDDILKWILVNKKLVYFDLNITEICSQRSNYQQASIGSDGLMSNRRRAIM